MIKYNNNDLKSRFITDSTGAVKEVKSVYVGSNKIWSAEFFCKITNRAGWPVPLAVSIQGSGALTQSMVSSYKSPIKNVEIGTLCTSVGEKCFYQFSKLNSLIISSTVSRLEKQCFFGCSGLTSITILNTEPPILYSAVFDGTNNCPIYVPAESVEVYKTASGWSGYADRIQAIQ